jgi:hypothetical protein
MTKAQLIEEILGSFSWDYLMENGLVSPRDGLWDVYFTVKED